MYSRNERKEMCTAEMCTADTREKERKSKNKSTGNDYAVAASLAVKVVLYRTDPFLETLWYYAYANLVHTTFVPKSKETSSQHSPHQRAPDGLTTMQRLREREIFKLRITRNVHVTFLQVQATGCVNHSCPCPAGDGRRLNFRNNLLLSWGWRIVR